jgi:hypothetical protein
MTQQQIGTMATAASTQQQSFKKENRQMKTTLKKTLRTTLAALGLALVGFGSATSWAADMCFVDDFNSVLVGPKFSFPSASTCKSFDGYELGTSCIITGTACGTSDNGRIAFNLNTSCPFVNYQGISSFRIDRVNSGLPQAGFGYSTQIGNPTLYQWHIKTVSCPNPHPLQ